MTQMPDLDEPDTVTRQQAADLLDLHIRTIDGYLADGTLTRLKREAAPKGGVRISREEVVRLLGVSRAPAVATTDTTGFTEGTGEEQ